jgi:hypothetical protein
MKVIDKKPPEGIAYQMVRDEPGGWALVQIKVRNGHTVITTIASGAGSKPANRTESDSKSSA